MSQAKDNTLRECFSAKIIQVKFTYGLGIIIKICPRCILYKFCRINHILSCKMPFTTTLSHLNFKYLRPSLDLKNNSNASLTFRASPLCITHHLTSEFSIIKHFISDVQDIFRKPQVETTGSLVLSPPICQTLLVLFR